MSHNYKHWCNSIFMLSPATRLQIPFMYQVLLTATLFLFLLMGKYAQLCARACGSIIRSGLQPNFSSQGHGRQWKIISMLSIFFENSRAYSVSFFPVIFLCIGFKKRWCCFRGPIAKTTRANFNGLLELNYEVHT